MKLRAKERTEAQKQSPILRERILEIAHLMAQGIYHRPTTPQALAAKWNVTDKTVENYASQAANLVRLRIGDDEQIRNEMLAALGAIRSLCVERANERSERNAYQWLNTALQSMDRIANLTGINAPKELRIKNEITLDDVEGLRATVEANECRVIELNSSPTPSPILTAFADYSTSYLSQGDVKSSLSTRSS